MMTFSVLPGMVPFGDVFHEVSQARPYSGPPMPGLVPTDGEVRVSVMGVQTGSGEFVVNADNPLAVYAIATQRWEREIRQFILDIMTHEAEYVTLVMDDPAVPEKTIAANSLWYVDTSRLRHSIFDVIDHRLQALRAYDGAKILVSNHLSDVVRKALAARPATGGRPEHPAKKWYFDRGCDRERRGITMKMLQAEMPKDAAGKPPSENTIRGWEKEYSRQKPPTESR
ncbi:MAG: hypothetical protein KL801_09385 [Mesorhizobium sp.]|nr:hypothetical protein [Mesorhizobium sp.]